MKKLLIIFLLVPTLAMSGIFKDDETRRGSSIKKVDININPKLKPVD